MTKEEIKFTIESLLFVSPRPLSIGKIKEVLGEVDGRTIRTLIEELQNEYEELGRSFHLIEIAEGYQICTRPQYAEWIKKLLKERNNSKLSPQALETLAIIAYKQPLTRIDIEAIRGVSVEGILRALLERGLIRISGRKDTPGRPLLYRTTNEFLRHFGLKDLEELPKLGELERSTGGVKNGYGEAT